MNKSNHIHAFITLFFIPFLALLIACGSQPDSSGKVYRIDVEKSKKERYAYLTTLINDEPDNHEAYYRRSKLFFEDSKLNEAQADINQALKIAPNNTDYLIQEALILFEKNGFDKVYRILQKIPSERKTLELQKIELISGVKTGKLTDAKSIEAAMTGMQLREGRESYLLGMLAWDKKDTAQAKLKLEDAYKHGEVGEDVLLTLSKIYEAENSDLKMQNVLEESARLYESKHSRILLANFYLRRKIITKEDSLYQVMLSDNPADSEVLMRRVNLYKAQSKNKELVDLLLNHYAETKTTEDDRQLADAYFVLRKNKEAKAIYETIEQSDTTGAIKKNLSILRKRLENEKFKNLPDSVRTISKDSVNSTP